MIFIILGEYLEGNYVKKCEPWTSALFVVPIFDLKPKITSKHELLTA
jgi:hypothetical protein